MLKYLPIVLIFGFASAAEPQVTVLVPSVVDKFGVSRLIDVLEEFGAPLHTELQPVGRIFRELSSSSPVCGLLTRRVTPPISSLQWVLRLFNFRIVAVSLPSVEGTPVKGDRVVTALNSAAFNVATELGYDVVPIKSYDQLVAVLNSRRATYWVDAEGAVKWAEKEWKIALRHHAVLSSEEVWLVCTSTVGADELKLTQSAWDAAKKSGELERIFKDLVVDENASP